EPERTSWAAPALAPQSTLPPGADPRRPRGDRARRVCRLQARRTGATGMPGTLIIIAIILALGWFLLAAPQRRRQRTHAAMQEALEVGDEIITAGGLHAVVRELGESQLEVEIAPKVVVTLDRRAVAAVAHELSEPEIRRQGKNQIVIELPAVHDPNRAAAIIGKTAQLELYDLTPSLLSPSIAANQQPVPSTSLYNLLTRVQTGQKGKPTAYYLF